MKKCIVLDSNEGIKFEDWNDKDNLALQKFDKLITK